MPPLARYLLDLSAWARSSQAHQRWQELVENDRLLCHPVFAIECLHNATTPTDYFQQRSDLEQAFDWIHPDEETGELAIHLQQRMATNQPCGQRVKSADLLIAALAVQHEVGVLHYDTDYDQIRELGGEDFESEWLAARGSLETADAAASNQRKAYRKAFGERMVQLRDDEDIALWPELIRWLDEQLSARGLPLPPSPAARRADAPQRR